MPRKHRPARPRQPKACRACASAKVRCELQGSTACTRCLRLKKDCAMQLPGAHKQVGLMSVYVPCPMDVARLEKKLDNMAAVVAASPGPHGPLAAGSGVGAGADSGVATAIFGCSVFSDISTEEAQCVLYKFQTQMAPYFPFVVVQDTTALELRQQKPFLFCTIVMVCLDDAERQLDMARNIREYIGASIVARGEKNIDLLQGLLVCLGWYHFQLELGSQIYNVFHLTLAMLIDLGLNRRPNSVKTVLPLEYSSDCERKIIFPLLEGQRVYLGCFYMSTIISTCFRDCDPMRYTAYTEECCRAIERAAKYPNDIYLVRLVRLHRRSDSISRTIRDQVDIPGISPTSLSTLLNTLKSELQYLKPPLPSTLQDTTLLLHHHNLEISLYEFALEDTLPTRYRNHPPQRVNILSSCLTATKSFIDLFSSLAPRSYPTLPYPIYAAYSHALETLSSLLLFSDEGWDLEYAREIIDLPATIGTFINKLEEAAGTFDTEQPPNNSSKSLSRIIPRLLAFEELHNAKSDARKRHTSKTPSCNIPDTAEDPRDVMFPLPHDFSWRFLRPR
ncbi:hypothetical protein BJX76DRAFT_352376 [Aspergillus varians]